MTWKNFCDFWINLGKEIQEWFIGKDTSGLNPISRLIIALCILIVGRFLIKLIIKILRKAFGLNNKLGVDVSVKTFSLSVANVLLNLGLAIFVLLILKVDFSSLSSIISAGTVAIGLYLQDLISAFASGVVLLKTKHFKTGDYIGIVHSDGNCEGTVSSIGLIAITLETYDNQHIVIPNNKVLQGVITNYTFNPTRRVVVEIKVNTDTDIQKAKSVIVDTITKDPRVLKDPACSVVVSDIDEYTMTLAIRCYAKNRDYWDLYFAVRENAIIALRDNHIRFPERKVAIEHQ